jgi:hypothetical protein
VLCLGSLQELKADSEAKGESTMRASFRYGSLKKQQAFSKF